MNKYTKIKGSTIIEVVTGLFLIALVIALSVVVFSKTMDYSNLYEKHQAVVAVNELIALKMEDKIVSREEFNTQKLKIVLSVSEYPESEKLQVIQVKAFSISTNRELYSRKIIQMIQNK